MRLLRPADGHRRHRRRGQSPVEFALPIPRFQAWIAAARAGDRRDAPAQGTVQGDAGTMQANTRNEGTMRTGGTIRTATGSSRRRQRGRMQRRRGSTFLRDRRGQSIVELAFITPLLLFLLLAIADFARLYATRLHVEAAAREAADYGTQWPYLWLPANRSATEAEMMLRACTAASDLTNYVGPATGCSNPTVTIEVIEAVATKSGAGGVSEAECGDVAVVTRTDIPCNVQVSLAYDFHLILPVQIQFGGTTLGLPSTLSFVQTSTFAVSDFEIDRP
jgi:Flp pilus assembly protein TadG